MEWPNDPMFNSIVTKPIYIRLLSPAKLKMEKKMQQQPLWESSGEMRQ
jgi:hypothetical protein